MRISEAARTMVHGLLPASPRAVLFINGKSYPVVGDIAITLAPVFDVPSFTIDAK